VDAALWLARSVGPPLLRGLAASLRFQEIGPGGIPAARLHETSQALYVLWHAHLLALTLRHADEDFAVIVSRHRDGEIISRMIERLGYLPVRGSSTRGGAAALRELLRAAALGHPMAITTDGPRGPARWCKPGAIQAASITGRPLIAVAGVPRRAWRFRSWDAFLLPAPGTTVFVTYGEPIFVPPDVSREALPDWQETVTAAQNRAAEICRRAAAEGTGR